MSLVERPVGGKPTTVQRITRRAALERDACVTEIGEHSPPTLFHAGEQLRLERLPVGSRVISAPPPVPALADVPGAVAAALDGPLGLDPLDALLRPGMRLTIAFDEDRKSTRLNSSHLV